MINLKKSIEQGFAGKSGGLYDVLKQLQNIGVGAGGDVFFVDGTNGSDTNNGESWDTAFKTIAYAITQSNLSVVEHTDGRNTILLRGALFAEDLTVPPIKCDVIGVGSSDEQNMVKVTGEHAWTGSATNESSAFYNIEFQNDDATEIFTIASPAGLYFYNCRFTAESACAGALVTSGTTGHDIVFKDCWFRNALDNDPFDTAAISIASTTHYNLLIEDCKIEGDIGVSIGATNAYACVINNCVIRAAGVTIDDNSDDCVITNNMLISAADQSTIGNVLDYNAALAAGNIVTGSGATLTAPTLSDLITYAG